MTATRMTRQQLITSAEVIMEVFTPEMIRDLHSIQGAGDSGAEMLRLIVRDDLAGAADKITSALWAGGL
jgi:hypothetical protein